MSQQNKQSKPNIVKTIFDRASKKSISSLFTHKATGAVSAGPGEKSTKERFFIKKLFPFGLDIGTDSIKIVQPALGQDGQIKIAKLIIEKLPKPAQEGPKERIRLLQDILKKILEDNGLKGDCFIAAPRRCVRIDFIKLPEIPQNEIEKALQWEMKQVIHQDISEISWDYNELKNQKAKLLPDRIGILAVSAPKKDIFEYLALLQSQGLSPLAADIEPLANLAALDYAGETRPDETALFLDFGAGETSLNIICNRELISTRSIGVTGDSLTKAVSEYCKAPLESAEVLKKTFGIAALDKEQDTTEPAKKEDIARLADKALSVRNAILPQLEDMVQDIEHTFKHFSYQMAQSQITRFDRLILSGGLSYLRGLAPFLRNRLHVDVDIIDSLAPFSPLEKYVATVNPIVLQNYGVNSLDELSPVLNVAVGLALRGME